MEQTERENERLRREVQEEKDRLETPEKRRKRLAELFMNKSKISKIQHQEHEEPEEESEEYDDYFLGISKEPEEKEIVIDPNETELEKMKRIITRDMPESFYTKSFKPALESQIHNEELKELYYFLKDGGFDRYFKIFKAVGITSVEKLISLYKEKKIQYLLFNLGERDPNISFDLAHYIANFLSRKNIDKIKTKYEHVNKTHKPPISSTITGAILTKEMLPKDIYNKEFMPIFRKEFYKKEKLYNFLKKANLLKHYELFLEHGITYDDIENFINKKISKEARSNIGKVLIHNSKSGDLTEFFDVLKFYILLKEIGLEDYFEIFRKNDVLNSFRDYYKIEDILSDSGFSMEDIDIIIDALGGRPIMKTERPEFKKIKKNLFQ